MLWDIYKDKKYTPYNTFILDDYDEERILAEVARRYEQNKYTLSAN